MPHSGKTSRPSSTSADVGDAQRACIYCRVSTEEQSREDHHSLHFQEEHCREYAKRRGFRVAEVRKDVRSGKDTDRPGYQELLHDIDSGAVDVVIVYRLDRLSRSVRDLCDFIHHTSRAQIGFASTSEALEATSAMGRAMLGVAAVFAQLHREIIAENVRDGMARRARLGKYTGPTGNPKYGYTYSPEQGRLLAKPNEAEEEVQLLRRLAKANCELPEETTQDRISLVEVHHDLKLAVGPAVFRVPSRAALRIRGSWVSDPTGCGDLKLAENWILARAAAFPTSLCRGSERASCANGRVGFCRVCKRHYAEHEGGARMRRGAPVLGA